MIMLIGKKWYFQKIYKLYSRWELNLIVNVSVFSEYHLQEWMELQTAKV